MRQIRTPSRSKTSVLRLNRKAEMESMPVWLGAAVVIYIFVCLWLPRCPDFKAFRIFRLAGDRCFYPLGELDRPRGSLIPALAFGRVEMPEDRSCGHTGAQDGACSRLFSIEYPQRLEAGFDPMIDGRVISGRV